MKIRTLIIDDEPLARQRVENLLIDVDAISVIGKCKNGNEAISKIQGLLPDLIFLDIQLKDMTGFDVLKQLDLSTMPLVVFVTAYDEFALKAFDCFAIDYLLKPFKDERFNQAMDKVVLHFDRNNATIYKQKLDELISYVKETNAPKVPPNHRGKLPVKVANKVVFVEIQEIAYVTAAGCYVEIHVKDKKYLIREPLTGLIKQLDDSLFIRVHRSTIVNTNFIKELICPAYGEVEVKMIDGNTFRISKSYKKAFNTRMGL